VTNAAETGKDHLWALTLDVIKRINPSKAGLQIKVAPVLKSHVKRYSPGYYVHFAHLMKGGGALGLYLDRYAGPQYRFWYGLYTESPARHKTFEAVTKSIVPGVPLRFTDKDYTEKPYERLRVPLSSFDRLLVERYATDGTHYCGLYSPYPVPLSAANLRSLVFEASEFLLNCARELLKLYQPSGGSKTTLRPPSSKKSDQAAIRFVRKTLETMKSPYRVQNRQKHICGYDLLAKRHVQPKELDVEVKGAAGAVARFFLSETEYKAATANPLWRLAVVTQATSKKKKLLPLMTAHQMNTQFNLWPIQWEGGPK